MANYYVVVPTPVGVDGTGRAEWAPNTHYHVGDRVVCRMAYGTVQARRWVYECTSAVGNQMSHATTEPTWPSSSGGTVTDNPGADQLVWTCRTPSSRANASLYLGYLLGVGTSTYFVGGDVVWVQNTVDEIWTSSVTLGNAFISFTPASPLYVIGTSDTTNSPPTSIAVGAKFRTSGQISWSMGSGVFYGIEFHVGYNGSSGQSFTVVETYSGAYFFENCRFKLAYAAASEINVGVSGSAYQPNSWRLRNCEYEFTHSAQYITPHNGMHEFIGGSVIGTPATLFNKTGYFRQPMLFAAGLDLSAVTGNLFSNGDRDLTASPLIISRCKLNAAATPFTGTVTAYNRVSPRIELCDSGTKNYRLMTEYYSGVLSEETTLIRTNGATDGTTGISFKLVANASNNRCCHILTPMLALWNDETGAAKTLTVEILHDNVTALKDDEIWVEALVLTNASFPIAELKSDQATVPFAGANQTTSDAIWTTTGMTNPNKQKLQVTFTPAMKGQILARVCFAKPTYTIYVDPMITLS